MEISQLTFTRFLAALTIIIYHYGRGCYPFNDGLLGHYGQEGAFAVSYFFCLSGYILAHVYDTEQSAQLTKKEFYFKRFARIFPLYVTGFIITLISGIFLLDAMPKGRSILLQLFGLHAWVPGICLEINYPAWSISVELFFYLCFPFLLKFFQQASSKKIILFTGSVWLISGLAHIFCKLYDPQQAKLWGEFMLYNPLFHINAFIFGMASCMLVKRKKIQWSNRLSTILFIVSAGTLFLIIATDNFILPWGHNGLFAPLFVLIIISLQANKKGITTIFGSKPFIFLGNISFAMYILQHPVREWFEQILKWMHATPGKEAEFYFYLIILILISALAFLSIEKPLRTKIIKNL